MKIFNRYAYSVVFFITTFILVAVVGFTVAKMGNSVNFTSVLNPLYTFLWRCLFYLSIAWSWEYLIRLRVADKAGIDLKSIVGQSRRKLFVSMILFELLIVHNGFWSVVIGLWGMLYGR
jgi:hypothetical protein